MKCSYRVSIHHPLTKTGNSRYALLPQFLHILLPLFLPLCPGLLDWKNALQLNSWPSNSVATEAKCRLSSLAVVPRSVKDDLSDHNTTSTCLKLPKTRELLLQKPSPFNLTGPVNVHFLITNSRFLVNKLQSLCKVVAKTNPDMNFTSETWTVDSAPLNH